MVSREDKINLINSLHWDYTVSVDDMLDVIEGKKERCTAFTAETLFARSLTVLMWQDVIRLWGAKRCDALYTDKVRRMLFPKSLRGEYDETFRILRGGSLSRAGCDTREREEMQSAFLFNRRNSNKNKNGLRTEGLKIDFVNDIPVHFGDIISTKVYYRTDSLRNILSNKYTALYRMSAKDVADICEIAKHCDFTWQTIIADAEQKELGIDLNDVVQIFNSFSDEDILNVKWKNAPDIERIRHDMDTVAHDMIVMQRNTLYKEYTRHNVITLDETGKALLDRLCKHCYEASP